MKSKQVIEVLEFTREYINDNSSGISNRVREEYGETNFNQAIDHAINCVGAIEQIKWERDIAIQQLNELGLALGQKTDEVQRAIEFYGVFQDDYKTVEDYTKGLKKTRDLNEELKKMEHTIGELANEYERTADKE